MRIPANSDVTLRFGSTDSPYSASNPHKGTDFSYVPDDTIYAPFSGTVILRPNNGRDGNGVYMYNGPEFHGMLHTSKYLVGDGEHVTEGQPIAKMGDTGYAFGVHLHWCVMRDGHFIDPMTLVTQTETKKMLNQHMIEMIWPMATGVAANQNDIDSWTGKDPEELLQYLTTNPNRLAYLKSIEKWQNEAALYEQNKDVQKLAQIKNILGDQ